jgi:hypothetical protein
MAREGIEQMTTKRGDPSINVCQTVRPLPQRRLEPPTKTAELLVAKGSFRPLWVTSVVTPRAVLLLLPSPRSAAAPFADDLRHPDASCGPYGPLAWLTRGSEEGRIGSSLL